MLNAITPLRCIAPTHAKQQAKLAPAEKEGGSQTIEHVWQGQLSDLKASHQKRPLDNILAAFRGPSREVQYPLGNKVIRTIRERLVLVRESEQEIQNFSADQLKELMSRIKHALNPSSQTASHLQEKAICQLLALANHVFAQYFSFTPYSVQILAVLGILASKGNFKGSLAQIKTGEGKSTVITLLALILAYQGKCIDVITSTEYLAKRDKVKYKRFFDFFDITTSHICNKALTPDHFSGQIVYGTNYNFEFSVLFDKFHLTANRTLYNNRNSSRPFHVAIVDEVDNMLLDKASNSARIAYSSQKNLTALYPIIYDFVKNNCLEKEPDIDTISECAKLVKSYQLSNTQLQKFIDSAYRACFKYELKKHYCLRKQNEHARHDANLQIVIIDQDTGRLSENSRWQHGLHQFLEYKHGLPILDETLTLGALSHPAFFAYYGEIYGVTGSLGAEIERNEVTEMYGLTSFDVPTHKPPLTQQLPTVICNTTERAFNHTLLSEVTNTIKAARPCLILCRSIAMSDALYQFIEPKFSNIQLLNDVQNEDEDFLVASAVYSDSVTIATNAAGRGTDIAVCAKAARNGGLHVIFTFFPNSERVEIQGAGRAGRQGNPGSYRIIVPHDDELLAKTGSGNIETLIALRELMVVKASLTRRQYAAIYLAQHHILERFWNDFQYKYANSIHQHAILNKWAEFYTDLENIKVNVEHHFDTALSNYRNTLNSLYDHFMKNLSA
ncbi:Putative uncharacterized protein [Mycoavidus cysteinexigens]|uniref:Uncharacterized protein n=1 Tax=Mycoavidus cysteinexigens TaxID=1553431 RepID=A0A2Z6ETE5_9BURK|nr:hypothetical protein [Mycoavidus cysteinexigens]BBE08693.1 Putative uncharacterized protein [Mycoavidus cysteinexigens]GAM52596.1 protein export cytoplasm protein SecA ATPase RNA helicase [bacterium endosymbiont of Mortierella elongata FMR23-6]GLR01445.1 hypothetical protein GCM10007934_12570 [Mycoavidus cysteinexigens]